VVGCARERDLGIGGASNRLRSLSIACYISGVTP
jgi:hypothetical protein